MDQRKSSLRGKIFHNTLNKSNRYINLDNQSYPYSNDQQFPIYYNPKLKSLSPKGFLLKSPQRFQIPFNSYDKKAPPIIANTKDHPTLSSFDSDQIKSALDKAVFAQNIMIKKRFINNNNYNDIIIKTPAYQSRYKKIFITPSETNSISTIPLNDSLSRVPSYGLAPMNHKNRVLYNQSLDEGPKKRIISNGNNFSKTRSNFYYKADNVGNNKLSDLKVFLNSHLPLSIFQETIRIKLNLLKQLIQIPIE